MAAPRSVEFKVGLFLNFGLALLVLGLFVLGSRKSFFEPKVRYHIAVPNAGGLLKGAKVLLAGAAVGSVDYFELGAGPRPVVIHLSLPRKYAEFIRLDSVAEVLTEGVVGDRVIEIKPGSQSYAAVPPGGEVPYHESPSLRGVFGAGEELFEKLNGIANSLDSLVKNKNLTRILEHMNRILTKMDRGSGTLSSLLNDPQLYDDAKSLVGEANENRVLRNLVRKAIEDAEKNRAPAGKR